VPGAARQALVSSARAPRWTSRLGEKLVEQLVDKELVRDLADLYRPTRPSRRSSAWKKSAQNLLRSSSAASGAPSRFLVALGIRQVGDATAKALAEHRDPRPILDERGGAAGPRRRPGGGAPIRRFFAERQNRRVIQRLLDAGVKPAAAVRAKGRSPEEAVLTGGLAAMTRPEAQRRIEALGGRVVSSVSTETDWVVVGAEAGSKLAKAKKLGVKILEEDAFLRLLEKR
jgi:DNA ligase (NAD+)